MGGKRGPGRRAKHKSRTAAALLTSATVVLAVLAGVGVVAFLHAGSRDVAQRRSAPLSTKVTSEQAVGLANLGQQGQAGAAGSSATLLYAGAGGLVFTPSSGGETVEPSQQWQADEMGGGGFVLLFTPDGLCLTATGSGARATAQLDPCDSGPDQRWYHPFQGTDGVGRDYWRLRSAADGRCLAVAATQSGGSALAAMQPCSASKPWPQLIMFWSAF
ncbi:MAG TPA: RICIN domain-containing protein [Streptosporangiaceae bacterium]|nr:RICIN domain-containing protein [Streptosporangiaceae bacterium]